MNISSNMPMSTAETGINISTGKAKRPLGVLAREWLTKHLPQKIPLGQPSLIGHLAHWEPQDNYVIAGTQATDATMMKLTLAQQFASNGGHVIWLGTADDLRRMSEQLMFKIAGIDLPATGTTVQLDDVAQCKLNHANKQIGKLWIDFCNVDDCGDTDVEQEFLASVSSFKPTLIVVDESIFDETISNPFEVLVRQSHALRMVEQLRGTNPMGSVLWQLPMPHTAVDIGMTTQRPSIDDLPDAASTIKPEVILFTHRNAEPEAKHDAEMIVATNAYGSPGTVPMVFNIKHSIGHELDAAASTTG
jgi:hypothetical protein